VATSGFRAACRCFRFHSTANGVFYFMLWRFSKYVIDRIEYVAHVFKSDIFKFPSFPTLLSSVDVLPSRPCLILFRLVVHQCLISADREFLVMDFVFELSALIGLKISVPEKSFIIFDIALTTDFINVSLGASPKVGHCSVPLNPIWI